tara:strand:+ start:21582 stop:22145 length:564 start_codon:yes stop_codon:yes gene_type:complete
MSLVVNPNNFRNNVKNVFTKLIGETRYGDNIERSIYNFSLLKANELNVIKKWENNDFANIYISKFKTLLFNLENANVRDLILSKKIKSYNIAFIEHKDLMPEKWYTLIEELKVKNDNKYMPKIEASSDGFECLKCMGNEIKLAKSENRKSRKEAYTQCTYYQLQTRSADEPMTTFVTCIKCNARWKC